MAAAFCFLAARRPVLIICLAVTLGGFLIGRMYISMNNKVLMSGITVNVTVDEAAAEALKAHCRANIAAGGRWEKVRLTQTALENFSAVDLAYQENYLALMSVISLNGNAELDYLLTDQLALETLLKQQLFLDLRTFFSAEELEPLGQAVIYARSSDMDASESYPVAVDISQLPYIRENAVTADKVYFGIAEGSPRTEQVRLVWEYLNQ